METSIYGRRERGGCGKRDIGSGPRDVVSGKGIDRGESGGYREGETVSVNRGFLREKEITGDSVFIIEKGEQCPSLKTFSGWKKSTGEGVVVIGKGEQCQSRETLPAERKSTGAEFPAVRRSVSVNVTDAVTQSNTDDVGCQDVAIQGVLVFGRDNCKGTVPYCCDTGIVSAVNERC
jgi:hypothetical protein